MGKSARSAKRRKSIQSKRQRQKKREDRERLRTAQGVKPAPLPRFRIGPHGPLVKVKEVQGDVVTGYVEGRESPITFSASLLQIVGGLSLPGVVQ